MLVGGGTGLIGDPAGKTGERALNAEEQVAAWADAAQARRSGRSSTSTAGRTRRSSSTTTTWLSRLELIPFLRDIGKHFCVGAMIARGVGAGARMERRGISYTEFSYQVLQAYDFLALHERHGCTLQIGGSDQWGNITAGTELIRRIGGRRGVRPHLPLVDQGRRRRSSARPRRARSGSIRRRRPRTRCTSSG